VDLRARFQIVLAVALAIAPARAPGALAQGTGRSMDIDVSVRSAAMGGASIAVSWGDGLNHWANPALLGYLDGIRYETGRTQLAPGLASDVIYTTRAVKAGLAGVGLYVSGAPGRTGGVGVDYGSSQGTDPFGNPTGAFRAYETVGSWGFGLSTTTIASHLVRRSGAEPAAFLRHVDVSAGIDIKQVDIVLAPPNVAGIGSTTAWDGGVLVRATPLDRLEAPRGAPVRIDLAWGHSWLSFNDDAIVGFGASGSARVSRHRRNGFSGRIAANVPGFPAGLPATGLRPALLRGLSPLVSLGLAGDHAVIDAGPGTSGYETDGGGLEVTFANVFSYRRGHFEDRLGGIDGTTTGWAVALPIGRWAGVRLERASFPQGAGLVDLDRKATSFWVDPLAIWESYRARR
jgi:hypothetical protein